MKLEILALVVIFGERAHCQMWKPASRVARMPLSWRNINNQADQPQQLSDPSTKALTSELFFVEDFERRTLRAVKCLDILVEYAKSRSKTRDQYTKTFHQGLPVLVEERKNYYSKYEEAHRILNKHDPNGMNDGLGMCVKDSLDINRFPHSILQMANLGTAGLKVKILRYLKMTEKQI